ncbi:MAG TPA: ABC transporter permease, partial [Puia sp.]|nr:ABC transporter permease [Puia sp.]
MSRYFNIILTSLKMALSEFRSNKLRTFLSLLGITFGIFCIISVLATINSMKIAVKDGINALGSNAVIVDKWEWMNTNDYPWWRFVNRPVPKSTEVEEIRQRVPIVQNITFFTQTNANAEYENNVLSNVNYYGVGEEFAKIEHFDIGQGRYLQQTEIDRGANSVVLGYNIASKLFDSPELAVDKVIRLKDGKT